MAAPLGALLEKVFACAGTFKIINSIDKMEAKQAFHDFHTLLYHAKCQSVIELPNPKEPCRYIICLIRNHSVYHWKQRHKGWTAYICGRPSDYACYSLTFHCLQWNALPEPHSGAPCCVQITFYAQLQLDGGGGHSYILWNYKAVIYTISV